MPELPEVETIRRQLAAKIIGKKILKTDVFTPKIVNIPISAFVKNTQSAKFVGVGRRAKLVVLELSNGAYLLCHLKLNGHLIFKKESEPTPKYSHVIFHLSSNGKLTFDDFRKFGYVKFVRSKPELEKIFEKEKYGPEPFSREFTLGKFKELLSKKPRSPIKTLLMDQKFVAGVGNVYAQEACFLAKVDPRRKVSTLNNREIANLYDGIIQIMAQAIEKRGNSVDSYLDAQGRMGEFQNYLKVYDREDKPCFRCKTKIKKFWMAGRGTSYCPKCQK